LKPLIQPNNNITNNGKREILTTIHGHNLTQQTRFHLVKSPLPWKSPNQFHNKNPNFLITWMEELILPWKNNNDTKDGIHQFLLLLIPMPHTQTHTPISQFLTWISDDYNNIMKIIWFWYKQGPHKLIEKKWGRKKE